MSDPDPNDEREQIREIIAGIRKLEQGAHMRSLMWFLAILTVTNVIIAAVNVVLLILRFHQ